MAERRMLARSIMESDMFSDMPVTTQMLYVRLNMAADDDGFVANPRAIMRGYGFTDDDMKLLVAKNFVLCFQKGDGFIYLIKHWKVHNYIQKDRYKASKFREILRDMFLDENNAYTVTEGNSRRPCLQPNCNISNPDTDCIQPVSILDTQDRLGKSKDRLEIGEDKKKENKVCTDTRTREETVYKDIGEDGVKSLEQQKIAEIYVHMLQEDIRKGRSIEPMKKLIKAKGMDPDELERRARSAT